MRLKLHHPWWTHLPAMVMLLVLIAAAALIIHWNLPVRKGFLSDAPIGSPYFALWYVAGAVLMLLGAIVYDEIWARGEVRKRYNSMSLYDEFAIGYLLSYFMLPNLAGAPMVGVATTAAYGIGFLICVYGVLLAAFLEEKRPLRPITVSLPTEDTSGVRDSIIEQFQTRMQWMYWENHVYGWRHYAVVLFSQMPLFGYTLMFAWELFREHPGIVIMLMSVLLMINIYLMIHYSMQRVIITKDRVMVRSPILSSVRIPIQRIDNVEIAGSDRLYGVRTHGMSDFTSLTALSQTGGVLLRTGKKYYYIGSKHPARLATVINTVKEYAATGGQAT